MKPGSLRKVLLPVLATLSLGGLLTLLLLYSRSPDMGLAQRLQGALQDYELHDAELARDVLLARAGLLPDYDALALDRQAVRASLAGIVAGRAAPPPPPTPDARRALDAPAGDLVRTHLARLAAVERFKSNNALLRNSLLYFAYVGPTLRMPLQGQALAAELGRLSYVVMSFMQSPSDELRLQIVGLLDRIDALGAGSADLRSLVAHARLLVRVLPLVDARLQAIHESPVDDYLQALRRAAMLHDASLEARARSFRGAMYVLSIGILLGLAWTWLRLREHARELALEKQAVERHRLQLLGANRLAVLGTHLEGIAHDIRNSISVMKDSASQATQCWPELRDALDRHAAGDPRFEPLGHPWQVVRGWLEDSHRLLPIGIGQLEALARRLLAFGNPAPEQPVAFDLNASLQDTLRLLETAVSKRTRNFRFLPGHGLPPARGEPLALGLVVLNLISNSLDALRGPEGSVTVRTVRAGDDRIAIRVEDDGCGIAPEVMARLFEPFFTTKQGRGGTGLGLGMSRATLQAMGGELHITSARDKGTCATVLLCVAREAT